MKEHALRNARVVLLHLPWLVLLGWFSSVAWFLCDDAFISFRYVRNLLEGHGLVFTPASMSRAIPISCGCWSWQRYRDCREWRRSGRRRGCRSLLPPAPSPQ